MFRDFKRKKSKWTQVDIENKIANHGGVTSINWRTLFKTDIVLDEPFLEKYVIPDNTRSILLVRFYYHLSERILQLIWNSNLHSHHNIFIYQDVSEDFIEKNVRAVDISGNYYIARYQRLSERFIRKHLDMKKHSYHVWFNSELSESFIEEFLHYVNWSYVSRYQNLSEAFIEKYNKKVKWGSIFAFQALSPDLILKYEKKFAASSKAKILRNKKIKKNAEFISKLGHLFDMKDLEIDSGSALEIIEANKFKFNLDNYLKSADEGALADLAKHLV